MDYLIKINGIKVVLFQIMNSDSSIMQWIITFASNCIIIIANLMSRKGKNGVWFLFRVSVCVCVAVVLEIRHNPSDLMLLNKR